MTTNESSGRLVYYRVLDVNHAGISEVLPGLYISGICALKPSIIQEYNITLIINATSEVPNSASLGALPRIKVWLEDTQESWALSYLDFVCDKILKVIARGGKVLIHSVQGVSRCSTICLAFLTKYKFKTLRDAYMHLASVRPKVEPNIGFWRQLISFEQDVKQGMSSVKIVRDQSNPSILVPDVYRKYMLRCKRKQQLQHASTRSNAERLKQTETSRLHQSLLGQKNMGIINEQACGSAPLLTTITESGIPKYTDDPNTEASGSTTGLHSPLLSSRKSRISRRKSSLTKKFQPVLEPLIEVV
uniref:Tyrosine-protein phosphatase domain-containing protein n=1 Tax=Elaeophora elaphi TaxID=1147741 RepID=A0A158Q8M7_9BILA